jgi:ketosteroid isomerase-like protein
MRFHLFFILSAAYLLTFTSCEQAAEAPVDLAQIKSELQTIEDAWASNLNTQNLDGLMAMYTEDAVSMPDNAPTLVGKDAIRKQQEQEFASTPAGMTYSFEVLDVYANGNTVTETGKSTYKDAAGKVTGTGKYMVVWEKQGDQYLCVREVYNNDAPPAPADTRSIHLFDLPEGVTEAEWLATLTELNNVILDLGYPGAGYHLYKTESADTEDYRYYFEGIWPSEEVYKKIHEAPAWKAASEKFDPLYAKIKAVEIYRRMNRVK